jgi:general secretion pathway protein J
MRMAVSLCSGKGQGQGPGSSKEQLDSGLRRNTKEAGFTLIELLVALLIFGLLSAAGVALLSFSVRAQDAAGQRMEEVAALRRTGALLAGDLAQAVPRPARDVNGRPQPAFRSGTGGSGSELFAFVRAGWENPDAAPRASLQKVEYRLAGETLERIAYLMVDGAAPRAPTPLLTGVRALRVRYRDAQGAWLDRWVPARADDMPRAIELEMETPRDGNVRQLFLVGGEG